MATIPVEFSIEQDDGTVERIDLHRVGSSRIETLIFDGAPITRNLEPGDYAVVCQLIGEDKQKMVVSWSAGGAPRQTLIRFTLHRGAWNVRDLGNGKLLGVDFNDFALRS
jgi:hypothetical protein